MVLKQLWLIREIEIDVPLSEYFCQEDEATFTVLTKIKLMFVQYKPVTRFSGYEAFPL